MLGPNLGNKEMETSNAFALLADEEESEYVPDSQDLDQGKAIAQAARTACTKRMNKSIQKTGTSNGVDVLQISGEVQASFPSATPRLQKAKCDVARVWNYGNYTLVCVSNLCHSVN